MKPTRILSEPFKIFDHGFWRLFLITDIGPMTLKGAAEAAGLERFTLNYRIRSHSLAWQDPDIFSTEHMPDGKWSRPRQAEKEQKIKDGTIEEEDAELIRKGRRDPLTVRHGSWEIRSMNRDMTEGKMRSLRLAMERRDEEYRDHLRHHRAMCR